jgi:hypothetical protein
VSVHPGILRDPGILFGNSVESTYRMGESYFSSKVKTDNKIFVAEVVLDDLKLHVDRQKYKVPEWISNAGGGFTAIRIFFTLLMAWLNYHEHDFMFSILSRLFKTKVRDVS